MRRKLVLLTALIIILVGTLSATSKVVGEDPDFNIVVEPADRNVVLGGSTNATVTVTAINDYSETVTLSASGQPAGVLVSFDPMSGTPTFTSTMTVNVGEDVEPKNWVITINGTGGDGTVHTTTFVCMREIRIKADCSIDPPDAPISTDDNVTYTFTEDIYDYIWVSRDNIIIDGNGHTLQGTGVGNGFSLGFRVTIRNVVIQNFSYGVFLDYSSNINITGTIITNNGIGVVLYGMGFGGNNTISGNNITNNECGIEIQMSMAEGNTIYHNNFIGNEIQARVWDSDYANKWDNGYPSGGNYWDDYGELDEDGDGIGDTPYVINADNATNNQDRYPLVVPLGPIPIILDGTIYPVELYSNSTISRFQVNMSQNLISFNVTGLDDTLGFCNLTIPNNLAVYIWLGVEVTVLVDGEEPIEMDIQTVGDYTYIYFTYLHSTHKVEIIPEFPTWTSMLLILMVFTVATAIYKRRELKTPLKQ